MDWVYLAFGHIHRPQKIRESGRARYAGSIDRFDFAEAKDDKSVVLFDVDHTGIKGEPIPLPLNATPLHKVEVHGQSEIDGLAARFPDAKRAIAELNDATVEGRNIKVMEAKPKEDKPRNNFRGGSGGGGGYNKNNRW